MVRLSNQEMLMNKVHLLFLSLLLLASCVTANAQDTGVHTEYMKDNKTTRVESSMLYVSNTPDQFVELRLLSWYKGEKLTAPPAKVDLEVLSFSKDPLYKKDKDRAFVIVADGQESTMGNLSNSVMKGETVKGVDTFFVVGGNPNLGVQVDVPPSARIKAGGNLNGITMEWMNLSMKPDQFLKLAKAAKLEFRIGATSLPLTDKQVEIVHNFANKIIVQ
jgi:hypothetical protein